LQRSDAQWYPLAQSVSATQLAPHAVVDWQAKWPGHGAAEPAPQLPDPSQVPWVIIPSLHAGVPQSVPALYCSQAEPSARQTPSSPQEVGAPVLQATWQQVLSTQLPFSHSELWPQNVPSGFLAQVPAEQ
jgi:hypothetical protein